MEEQQDKFGMGRAPDAIGVVEEVVFHNPSNDYTVLELIDSRTNELVTAVGMIPYAAEGETLLLWGDWANHPDYGKQLCVTVYDKQLPTNTSDILRYLSSKTIRGVGPSTALKMVNRFGAETFDVIEKHPEWLADIPGITRKKAAEINAAFRQQAELRSLMTLCGGKIGVAAVNRIFRMWGNSATGFLKRDPYRLCRDVGGISFEKADEIAEMLGVGREADVRVRAGIDYVLSYNASVNGHSCLPREKLLAAAAQTLSLDEESVEAALEEEVRQGNAASHRIADREMIFSRTCEEAEQTVADRLSEISRGAVTFAHTDLVRLIDRMETEWGIQYAAMQRQAIGEALSSGVMIITGGPGTGKTTIIRALLRIFDILGFKTALAAPTGRAAKRMSEATVHEAKTVHRMLEMERTAEDVPRFRRDSENPLDEMAVIVDEASMIDLPLMASLVRAMRRGSRLILVGDADQLPSVGCGNVLSDLIASGAFPTVRLTEIFRQAEESLIVTNAHRINEGQMPLLDVKDADFFFLSRPQEESIVPTVVSLISQRLPKAYGADIRARIQVISPTRRGRAGTEQLNLALQAALNPPEKGKREVKAHGVVFRTGDRVMQIRNHYDLEWKKGDFEGMGVFNGDMGEIVKIDPEEETLSVSFDERIVKYEFSMLDELELAYAVTVHKSQGSEYPVVIMPLASAPPMLQTRNLLYTALTRAREKVILVGRREIVSQMVENDRQVLRYTGLQQRLEGAR